MNIHVYIYIYIHKYIHTHKCGYLFMPFDRNTTPGNVQISATRMVGGFNLHKLRLYYHLKSTVAM